MSIEIKIIDVFHLSFGYSVFAGKFIGEEPRYLSNGYIADLIIDGSIYLQNIKIGGRMMGRTHPDGYIGIATVKHVSVTSEFIRDRDCYLCLRKVEII
jgi:hypothetical protein